MTTYTKLGGRYWEPEVIRVTDGEEPELSPGRWAVAREGEDPYFITVPDDRA